MLNTKIQDMLCKLCLAQHAFEVYLRKPRRLPAGGLRVPWLEGYALTGETRRICLFLADYGDLLNAYVGSV